MLIVDLRSYGEYALAVTPLREQVTVLQALPDPEHDEGRARHGAPGEAVPPYREALAIQRTHLGEAHPDVARS